MGEWQSEADLSGAVLRSETKYLSIVDALRREIMLGRVLAGQRLPPMPALVARFEATDRTVRRALQYLEEGGILAPDGAGWLVFRDPEPDRNLLRPGLRADPEGILRFTEYRAVLEAGAAWYAAQHRTEADLEEMERAQRVLHDTHDPVTARNADTAFHIAVARASQNTLLVEAVEDARMELFGAVDLMRIEFIKEASYHGHGVILRGILAGDGHEAADAMRLHIETTRDQFQRLLGFGH